MLVEISVSESDAKKITTKLAALFEQGILKFDPTAHMIRNRIEVIKSRPGCLREKNSDLDCEDMLLYELTMTLGLYKELMDFETRMQVSAIAYCSYIQVYQHPRIVDEDSSDFQWFVRMRTVKKGADEIDQPRSEWKLVQMVFPSLRTSCFNFLI